MHGEVVIRTFYFCSPSACRKAYYCGERLLQILLFQINISYLDLHLLCLLLDISASIVKAASISMIKNSYKWNRE